ncbi:hypothetical protein PILCRDRAFT_824102 [Piloderma croceum F 1598]|uniref:Uncharacterized protein n=1 Tax=Piloderma croceum (strain F 1598) TaxID=765440 RepID=A0A0C3BNR2_PILCF|nr:hypothetical protein PILCRDRAFT_824102 [Piloderma croceum F 1598]
MLSPSLLMHGKLFQLSQMLWDACRCHSPPNVQEVFVLYIGRFTMHFRGGLAVELVPGECPMPHSHSDFSDFSDRFWGL